MGEKPLHVMGSHDDKTLRQAKQVLEHERAVRGALMADGHLGYGMPIGGVVAYDNAVSPEGVGFDIGCGNKAVRTNLVASQLESEMPEIMDRIFDEVAFGVGSASGAFAEHPIFDDARFEIPFVTPLKETARKQLGSVGSGNHYVDVLADEDGYIWVGVHFGSRGLGHKIASQFMTEGDMMKPVTVLDLDSTRGTDYWDAMELAGAYARAGRDCVVRQVLAILDAKPTLEVHNHHNFAWKEHHDGREVVVVRKGATPAFASQEGFVGGSMGDDAVILEGAPTGREEEARELALCSTVHGAGRVMSRSQAKGRRNRKTGEVKNPGLVSPEAMRIWLEDFGVVLRGGDVDEAPQVYRRLRDVLAAQGGTVRVTHTLRPLGVAMAGPRDHDPFKD